MEHKQAFSTARRAGCACGFVAESNSRENARRQLIRHIINPQAPGKLADAPADHAGCTVEKWSDRWGVCAAHSKYVDLEANTVDTQQGVFAL